MSDRKATRSGLNVMIRVLGSLPSRAEAGRAWAMTPEEFWQYQGQAFRRIYEFARARVPYYRDRPEAYPALPPSEVPVRDFLATLPILSKETVRQANEEFWPQPRLPLTTYHKTSGTSGTPLRLAGTLGERGRGRAIYESWMLRICGQRRPRTLYLTGFLVPRNAEDLFWRDRVWGHGFLSIYSLNEANREKIIQIIREHDPRLIYGYASALQELALLVGPDETGAKDRRVAVSTSEVLYPDWRTTIEGALCRHIFDMYGSMEGSHMVLECAEGGRHIQPQIGLIELLDDQDRPCPAGESGRVIVTGLNRRSMPLFRYQLGDVAESTGYATDCACGCGWPMLGHVGGRSEDLVVTRDGRRIGYLTFHATRALLGVKECQLIQTGYEQFVCNLVLAEGNGVEAAQVESNIRTEIENRMQMPVEIEFRHLASVPRGAGGKFRAVVVDFDKK